MDEPATTEPPGTPGPSGTAGEDADAPGPGGVRLLVRVAFPDRPGALGHVAGRIGSLGADIVGVDVLERTDQTVIDEFAVALPRGDLVPLLLREIEEVDGASVEGCHAVERFPDPRLDALVSAEHLCRAGDEAGVYRVLAEGVRVEFEADWTAVVGAGGVRAASGDGVPPPEALAGPAEQVAGVLVTTGTLAGAHVAAAAIPGRGAALVAGRAAHPFRRRERRQLLALTRIAARVADLLSDQS